MFLKGDKIILRPIEVSDANQEYLSWVNDQTITSGLVTGYFPQNLDQLSNYIKSTLNRGVVFLAICDKSTNQHIGNIKLDSIDWIARTAEIGILLGNKAFWGKGIGTEAFHLLTDYGFTGLNLNKIWLTVFSNNPSAIKLYQKLGFIEEGVLKHHIFKNGEYLDKIYMAKFKE